LESGRNREFAGLILGRWWLSFGSLGVVSAMNHIGIYFACVLLLLLGFSTTFILVARAKQWKPKPMRLGWAILTVSLAVLVAGAICSFVGRDIHILFWWLLGALAFAVFYPLNLVLCTIVTRLVWRAVLLIFHSKR
jgi:hypothetical protein